MVRPPLPRVQHAQDFDRLAAQSVCHNIGRSIHHQFPRSSTPARTANFRKTQQPRHRNENAPDLIVSGRRVVVSDIGASSRQIAERRSSPD